MWQPYVINYYDRFKPAICRDWIKNNPRKDLESDDAYYERYNSGVIGPLEKHWFCELTSDEGYKFVREMLGFK